MPLAITLDFSDISNSSSSFIVLFVYKFLGMFESKQYEDNQITNFSFWLELMNLRFFNLLLFS